MSPRTCEWCGATVGTRRQRLLALPPEYGDRKLYFHPACLEKFKDANPNLMKKKENDALQRNR